MSTSIKKCKTLPQIPLCVNSTSTFGQSRPTPPQLITNYTSSDLDIDSNTNLLENSPRTNEEWTDFWSQIGVIRNQEAEEAEHYGPDESYENIITMYIP